MSNDQGNRLFLYVDSKGKKLFIPIVIVQNRGSLMLGNGGKVCDHLIATVIR
jgi:hypothetical protein